MGHAMAQHQLCETESPEFCGIRRVLSVPACRVALDTIYLHPKNREDNTLCPTPPPCLSTQVPMMRNAALYNNIL